MELRHLRMVKAVVEEGSISRAIDKLYLTQSALSHQLRELESQLGTKVFYRVNKKLILTPAGEKVLETAKKVLSEVDSTKREINELISGEKGSIKLRTKCYTAYHWLPALLKEFHLDHPNIDVQIFYDDGSDIIQQIKEGKLDLSITNFPVEDDKIEYVELFRDELKAILPENHPLAAKEFLEPEDFKDEALFIYSLPLETVVVYEHFLKPAGVTPQRVTPIPLTEATIEMIKAGMGISVMSRWATNAYLDSGALKSMRVGREGLYRHQFAALLKVENRPEYYDTFLHFLKESMNETIEN